MTFRRSVPAKILIGFFFFIFISFSAQAAQEPYSILEKWAAKSPAGGYPSWFQQKEPELFQLGVPENNRKGFLGADGSVQAGIRGFSLTPFLIYRHKVWSSGEFSLSRRFLNEGVPIPWVHWNSSGLRLSIRAFVAGTPGKNILYARYEIHNLSPASLEGDLALALRPFRLECVNKDCFSPIYNFQYSQAARAVLINEVPKVFFSQNAAHSGAVPLQKKDITPYLLKQKIPEIRTAKDERGFASGVLIFHYALKIKRKALLTLAIPLEEDQQANPKDYSQDLIEIEAYWRKKLAQTKIELHPETLRDLQREELAALLIRRAGPGHYPTREGSLWTGETLKNTMALVQRGVHQEAQEDLDEVSKGIDPSGEVAAQIDAPQISIPEYQNQGKTIFAWVRAAKMWQDRNWLQAKMPLIQKILEYQVRLRKERLTYWYDSVDPDRKRFLGILPPSQDHASKNPESRHRYLDDLWALRGWKDGQEAGRFIHNEEKNYWMKMEERGLRRSVLDSMDLAAEEQHVDFIPVYPDSAEYNAQIGIMSYWPLEEAGFMPHSRLRRHLDLYEDLFQKAKQKEPQKAFQFSNLEAVQTFLRAGRPPAEDMKTHRREQAFEMLRYYLQHRPAAPPKGEAALLKFFRSACVYEAQGKLILGAGILKEWISPKSGLRVKLPTEYGDLSFILQKTAEGYHFRAEGSAQPPQGFLFYLPEGNPVKRFEKLPAEFDIKE